MTKKETINVQGIAITVITSKEDDYISLTDMANAKAGEARAADVIKNWIRTRTTLEFLGTWEQLYNPDFNVVEFDHFKMHAGLPSLEADLLNVALFGMTAKQWRDANPDLKGNIRDYATLEQLVVLSNMESINALLIQQQLTQGERLVQLNKVAITQMRSLVENRNLKQIIIP